MSMFKSLQNMPGVITIFHSPNMKASSDVLKLLEKSAYSLESSHETRGFLSKLLKGTPDARKKAPKYQLDVSQSFPTPDQYKFIKGTISTHPDCKTAFKEAFPQWGTALDKAKDVEKLPSVSEVTKLTTGKTLDELVAQKMFVPPLVVDWDNQLIASSPEQLTKVLANYSKSEDM